jgi:hypothetical protein
LVSDVKSENTVPSIILVFGPKRDDVKILGENRIMRSFIIRALHQILSMRSNKRE